MRSAGFLSMMLGIEVHQTREFCFSESAGPLGAFFCKFQVCFHVSSLRRRTSLAIKPRSVESCSDVCPSLGFSYLHIWSWSSTRVTIRFLVTTLTKALLHQLLRLDKRPALGRILLVSNLRVPETTCVCDPSIQQNYFLNSSPDELFPTHFI